MTKRSFFAEFGLSMVGTPFAISHQENLSEVAEKADAIGFVPHIYMIAQRPRLTLDPNSISITKERIKGIFYAQRRTGPESIPWDVSNPLGVGELKLECEYPYNAFSLTAPDGRMIGGDVSAVLTSFQPPALLPESHPALDLEVLYVGQAYGKEGARSAIDRLTRHETLQKIYADANRRSPEMDILIIIWRFNETQLMTFFPPDTDETQDESIKANDEHVDQVLKTPISEEHKVNFTEAALIRYFQPIYNIRFKDQFPTPEHSSYVECYDADLNLVAAEIQMADVNTRIGGPGAVPAFFHFATYPLHSKEERRNMFDFVSHNLLVHGPVL